MSQVLYTIPDTCLVTSCLANRGQETAVVADLQVVGLDCLQYSKLNRSDPLKVSTRYLLEKLPIHSVFTSANSPSFLSWHASLHASMRG